MRRQQQPDVQAAMGETVEIRAGEAQALHVRRNPCRRHHRDLAEEDRRAGIAAVALPAQSTGGAEMLRDTAGDRHLHVGEAGLIYCRNADQHGVALKRGA